MKVIGPVEMMKIVDVFCDHCKKSTRDCGKQNLEYAELKAHWGYYSSKDMQKHELHLCEPCYDILLDLMYQHMNKLKPTIEEDCL